MYCPIAIKSPALSFDIKEKNLQQRGVRVANGIVFNKVRIYHEKVYAKTS